MIDKIIKRDGRIASFDREKITFAVLRAAVAVGGRDRDIAEHITNDVITMLEAQRRAFDAEGQYITVRRQRLESRVDLYLALGGDFSIDSLNH